jgi:rod shape-determining protein MreB
MANSQLHHIGYPLTYRLKERLMTRANPLNALLGWSARDVGIDLGTTNTLIYVPGKGIVINEPSVVAIDTRTGHVAAIGAAASAMIGKTPANIRAIRPLQAGVIADFGVVAQMLALFIQQARAHLSSLYAARPRIVVSVPCGITPMERRAARDAALRANAAEAYIIEEPMAAAIGAGLPINEPLGSMIVDIGGGTTEVTVISLGGIVINRAIPIAGDALDAAIMQFARHEFNLLIGERMAERAKIAAGSAAPLDEEITVVLRGRDMLSGLPKAVEVSSVEIQAGIASVIDTIVAVVRDTLEETPPELLADLTEYGMRLAGGGALLKGLDQRIAAETRMPVHVVEDPLACVARGAGTLAEGLWDRRYRTLLAGAHLTPRVR